MFILVIFNMVMNFVMTSSIYWFSSWVIMELMGFTFVMVLSDSRSASVNNKIIMWKYFLFQCLGSIMFLISMFLKINHVTYMNSYSINTLLLAGFMMKLGLPPFHKWSFEVSENLSWLKFLMINSVQKIPSVIMMWKLMDASYMMLTMQLMSLMFSLMGLFDWSLRRFLIYSSIINYVWVLSCSVVDSTSMLLYLMVYLLSLMTVILILDKFSFSSFSFLFSNNMFMLVGSLNMVLSINMMSLSGLPPLAGFISKYDVVMSLINSQFLLSVILVFVSLIMLIMYMIIMVAFMNSNKINGKWATKKDYFVIIISLINLVFVLLYFM